MEAEGINFDKYKYRIMENLDIEKNTFAKEVQT